MVDIIIFLQSQKKDPWLSVLWLIMVGSIDNLLLGILFNINFSAKKN
jgi:hypothetical protein